MRTISNSGPGAGVAAILVIGAVVLSVCGFARAADIYPDTMDLAAEGFSLRNASFLVSLVEVAGQNDAGRIQTQLAAVGFVRSTLIKGRVLHCVLAEHEDYLVLAFRGSTTMQDWLTDLKFTQSKSKRTGLPGKVHRGFYQSLDQEWPRLSDLLKHAGESGKPIWITGHSLGGGLAHLAAMRAAQEGIGVAGVYTFASPRVGNDTFASAYDRVYRGRSFRVVNSNDLVPHVPPSQPAEGVFGRIVAPVGDTLELKMAVKGAFMMVHYTHAGDLYLFEDTGAFAGRRAYSDRSDVGYWQRVESEYGDGSWLVLVDDQGKIARNHFLAAYIKVLHEAARTADNTG